MKADEFELGEVLATPGALRTFGVVGCAFFLVRHGSGDWGELCASDRRQNEIALREGLRLLSGYETPAGKAWVITEADRSVTTVLLPEEY
jgi:hypothetical protein